MEQKKVENSTLFSEGYCFGPKKGRKQYPSEEGYPFSTHRGTFFLNNHIYETVPLSHWGTKIVPLRVPYYGQSNSDHRGTVSVPFFSECRASYLMRWDITGQILCPKTRSG